MVFKVNGGIMRKRKIRFIILTIVTALFTSSLFSAETWRLGEEGQWKAVSAEDKYLLAVAEIKKLVNMGETEQVKQAIDKLKQDFPEIAGPDLDAFMEAEILYSKGQFTKAARSYDKFLEEFPASEFYEAALSRQFAIGTAFLSGQKKKVAKGMFEIKGYAEGAKIMERISDQAPDSPIGVRAAVAVARSLEERGKFSEAYHKWSEISSRWPTGQIAKDAALGMARCKHATYRGPKYDVSNLIGAKSYYESFKLRYPAEAAELDVDRILKQIDEQLAYKQFSIGQYYQRTGSEQSANVYYQMVIDNWPGSTAAEMAKRAMSGEKISAEEGKKWKKNLVNKIEELLL